MVLTFSLDGQMLTSLNLKYMALIQVVHICETVGCEIPKRQPIKPRRKRQRTKQNSFSGDQQGEDDYSVFPGTHIYM